MNNKKHFDKSTNIDEQYFIATITGVVHKTSRDIEKIIEENEKRLPEGLKLTLTTEDVSTNGITSSANKYITVGINIQESILPQEFQVAIRQVVEHLKGSPVCSQKPQLHPNHNHHHKGLVTLPDGSLRRV